MNPRSKTEVMLSFGFSVTTNKGITRTLSKGELIRRLIALGMIMACGHGITSNIRVESRLKWEENQARPALRGINLDFFDYVCSLSGHGLGLLMCWCHWLNTG